MKKKQIVSMMLAIGLVTEAFSPFTSYAAEWKTAENGKKQYEDDNGNLLTDCFEEIEGEIYSFSPEGYMNVGWIYNDAHWYYFSDEGKMIKNRWLWINDKCYYFYEDGHMASNEVIDGSYVTQSGEWIPDKWIYSSSAHKWWYRYGDGSYAKGGLVEIGSQTYCFDDSGYMQIGWQYFDGKWYYLSKDGSMVKNGWLWINDKCYYFYEDGHMASNEMINGSYVNHSGEWVQDQWIYSKSAHKWWYRYAQGNYPYNEWKEINGKIYSFDETGYMNTGWLYKDSKWYYFDPSGAMQTGWNYINNIWYWMNDAGEMVTGKQQINGKTYLFSTSGAMQTGWQYSEGKWYYYLTSGELAHQWFVADGNWYYSDENGVMQTGKLVLNGKTYLLAPSGYMITGWNYTDGKWYYYDRSGAMQTGWYFVDGTKYYSDEDGVMQTGKITIDGKEYYLKSSGALATGWAYKNNSWYYLDKDGQLAKNSWQWIVDSWYYFNSNGVMHTGWLQLNGHWYYLKNSGAMQRGWAVIGSKHYHFNANGEMDKEQAYASTCITPRPGYYISPMLADSLNTRSERIEAMISTAYSYLGTTYRPCNAGKPGTLVDCSGLVMQGLYAAGYDPYPVSPWRHALPEYEYESRNLWKLPMKHVSYSNIERGDLVFYTSSNSGLVNHVAIYLGDGKVIEAWPPKVMIQSMINYQHGHITGFLRPFE